MNACDILKYGHLTVLKTLEGLPPDDWEEPDVCGWWSTKQVIAHLASYELVLIDVLEVFQGKDPTDCLVEFTKRDSHFNDQQVAQRDEMSPADVLAEYEEAHAQTMLLIAQIPGEMLHQPGTLPWYGLEYSLDDFLVYQYYGHKREHSAQIAVFRDRIAR